MEWESVGGYGWADDLQSTSWRNSTVLLDYNKIKGRWGQEMQVGCLLNSLICLISVGYLSFMRFWCLSSKYTKRWGNFEKLNCSQFFFTTRHNCTHCSYQGLPKLNCTHCSRVRPNNEYNRALCCCIWSLFGEKQTLQISLDWATNCCVLCVGSTV